MIKKLKTKAEISCLLKLEQSLSNINDIGSAYYKQALKDMFLYLEENNHIFDLEQIKYDLKEEIIEKAEEEGLEVNTIDVYKEINGIVVSAIADVHVLEKKLLGGSDNYGNHEKLTEFEVTVENIDYDVEFA